MASSLATSDYGERTKRLWACGWTQSSSDLKAGHRVSTGLRLGGQTLQSHWTETISRPRCWTPFIAKNVSWPEPAVVQGLCVSYSVMSDSLRSHGQDPLPGSSVHGILQARILEWVAVPSCKGSSQPRDRTCVSFIFCIHRQIPYHYAT